MNYIYSELNSSAVNTLGWGSFSTLPPANSSNYMTIAVITTNNIDSVYLCVKGNGGYEWVPIVAGSTPIPQLHPPVVQLSGTTISWSSIEGAVSYTVYEDDTIVQAGVTATSYDVSVKITTPGIHHIKVKAIGDSTSYLDSDFSNTVDYSVIYKMYWGTSFDIPTTIDSTYQSENCPLTLQTDGAVHYFTTKTEGEERGKHCIYAYPSYYGDLKHIYCNDLTSFDLINEWEKIVINYNNMEYNLYYQRNATKDVNSKYQYLFIL